MSDSRIPVTIVSEPGKAGVKTHLVDLLSHLNLNKFEVTYFYSLQRSDDAYRGEIAGLRERGIYCVELLMDEGLGFLKNLRALFQLVGGLKRSKPAILHLHSSKAGGLGRLASLFIHPKPKVLYTPHAMACYRSQTFMWLERLLGYLTYRLIAVSSSEAQDFKKWRIPRANEAAVISLGVQPFEMKANSIKDASRWTVGACGRVCYQKNALLFFQMALEIIERDKKYHFKWIGDFGDDEEAVAVKTLLKKAGNPSRITITGWIRNPRPEIELLDLFCMFSRYESFGYVTAEAMLMGIPVVATAATGTVDLIRHEVTGLLAMQSVPEVVSMLDRLETDADLRKELTMNARTFVLDNHTIAKMVTETENLYLQCSPFVKI